MFHNVSGSAVNDHGHCQTGCVRRAWRKSPRRPAVHRQSAAAQGACLRPASAAPRRVEGSSQPNPGAPSTEQTWHAPRAWGRRRVRSHCRFRNRSTEYVSEYGMKWMGGSTKRQCDRAPGRRGTRRGARQAGYATAGLYLQHAKDRVLGQLLRDLRLHARLQPETHRVDPESGSILRLL
jgi:hypothetical protein